MIPGVVSSIQNFLEIPPDLGTGGQPTESQLSNLGAAGYTMVINLAMPQSEEALVNEDFLVTAQGIDYVHLPVTWEAPAQDHVLKFFDLVDCNRGGKTFVHCIRNMRVAVFVYLYRTCRREVPAEAAREDLLKIWRPRGTWRRLIVDMVGEDACPV
ncbi:MAG: protein tyrosine phosphatase family protein [Anaerolineae bacterium]